MASLSGFMRTMVLMTFGLRCYAQLTMALQVWQRVHDAAGAARVGTLCVLRVADACAHKRGQ